MTTFDEDLSDPSPKRKPRSCLFWVILVLLIGMLLCGGLCAGGLYYFFGRHKSSEPFQMSLEQVRKSPEVIERLGSEIEPSIRIYGNSDIQENQGSYRLYFNVTGPDGSANVHSESTMVDGSWGITLLEVTFEDGKKILLDSGEDDLEDAPIWQPPEEEPSGGIDLSKPEDVEVPLIPDPPQEIEIPIAR